MRSAASAAAPIATALLLLPAPAPAAHDGDFEPQLAASWESAADGGMLSDDVAGLAVASRSRNNSVESLFVTASRAKSEALQALGIDDLDVATTAFDAATGDERWTVAYDAGLDIVDRPAGLELNYNNNILHVVVESGSDASIVTYAVSDGDELGVQALPGASVNGSAITVSGSELAVVGQRGGDFWFADYESGPQAITIDSTPVSGEAFDVAIHNKTWINGQGQSDWAPGDIDSWRTFVATGRSGGFSSADVYTAAWRTDQSGDAPVWVQSWDGPDGDWDEGLAAETGYVSATGETFAWTAGRTRDAGGDWDVFVRAHDLNSGAPAWTGDVRIWGGHASDEAPVAMWYADATRTLYVTGTTDLGFPHGTDVFTLAYDATSGELLRVAFSSGDISNGDDAPTDVTATHDGSRVLVAAEFHDLLEGGGGAHRAGVFAFDGELNPAGTGWLAENGSGTDHAGGVAVDIDQTAVLFGGSADPESTSGHDLAGASFPLADFEVLPEPGAAASWAAGVALLAGLRRRRSGSGSDSDRLR